MCNLVSMVSRISQTGVPTPEFGVKPNYLPRFLLKTAWKWKKLGWEEGHAFLVPPLYRWIRQCLFFFKKKNFWEDISPFCGTTKSFFWFLVTSPLGLKVRVGSLIHALWRHICYTFPEIHLWCNTYQPLDSQHGSQADLFYIPVSRHWWGSKPGPIMLQTKALLIDLWWLGMFVLLVLLPEFRKIKSMVTWGEFPCPNIAEWKVSQVEFQLPFE